jgi:hypothetical protein
MSSASTISAKRSLSPGVDFFFRPSRYSCRDVLSSHPHPYKGGDVTISACTLQMAVCDV